MIIDPTQIIQLMINVLAEGKGETEAGPSLVRRILENQLGEFYIQPSGRSTVTPGKGYLVKNFEALISLVTKRAGCDGVLVLVDSDEECAAELAKALATRAGAISPVPVAVVCPVREFENWFVCSAESICPSESAPDDCEHSPDPKGWLKSCLSGGYKQTLDQARLVYHIDFDLALPRSRSLQRMVNAVTQLVESIQSGTVIYTP